MFTYVPINQNDYIVICRCLVLLIGFFWRFHIPETYLSIVLQTSLFEGLCTDNGQALSVYRK